MARVEKISKAEMERNSVHGLVEATYAVFADSKGDVYLQIDTYGSETRDIPGKKSQSIQFGPTGLAELRRILDAI